MSEVSYRRLQEISKQWFDRNPDYCRVCFCRPGKGDSEEGTDHEKCCVNNYPKEKN